MHELPPGMAKRDLARIPTESRPLYREPLVWSKEAESIQRKYHDDGCGAILCAVMRPVFDRCGC